MEKDHNKTTTTLSAAQPLTLNKEHSNLIHLGFTESERKWIISYFEKKYEQHGNSHLAADWGSRESQERRYEILSEIGRLEGRSVLDVYCGLAHLYYFLRRRGVNLDYTGHSTVPAFLRHIKTKDKDLNVELRDILFEVIENRWDYVFASGIFYLKVSDNEAYMKKMIEKMYALSKIGVAFNSLSSYAPFQNDKEYYADPEKVFKFCKTLCGDVVLRHDYMSHDFTIYMYKS